MSTKTKSSKKLDKEISQAFTSVFDGMAIPIFDVTTIYRDTKLLVEFKGLSVESALELIKAEYKENDAGHFNRVKGA
jgi:hypothetical protein